MSASVQVPFDCPVPGARPRQFFKARLERGRRLVERLCRPWAFCRCCGEPLPRRKLGQVCDDCHGWSRAIIQAHESARVRRLFAEFP